MSVLQSQFDSNIIFEKVEELSKQRAVNTIDGKAIDVPFSRGWASGFSCASRSSRSVNSAKN
eukprot:10600088-Heterocapsa_arctica.AAC.1